MMSKQTLGQKIVSLVYPIDCLGCGREDSWLCVDCQKQYRRIRLENCFICSRIGQNGICRKCQEQTGLDGIVSIFPYSAPVAKQLVYNGKYFGYHNALSFIGQLYRGRVQRLLPDQIEHLSFIPLTNTRRKKRGYNQAEIFAQALAGSDLVVTKLFDKTRETKSQTCLTKKQRRKNVQGSLKLLAKNLPEAVAIVDDVITTGATLSTAVKLLRRKKVRTIWAVTICHG